MWFVSMSAAPAALRATALGLRGLHERLAERRRALLEALGAAPRGAPVRMRGLWPALLAEARGCVVVQDAALEERARAHNAP